MIKLNWPNGKRSIAKEGDDWFAQAKSVGLEIPTGCLNGSCGACEIDVNGKTLRACIKSIERDESEELNIDLMHDPYW